MKICVMSDLHLEFEDARDSSILNAPPAVEADLVLLAGDVHTRARGPAWAAKAFPDKPVVMIGGNHETYKDSLYASIAKNRQAADAQGLLPDGTRHVTWLEREVFRWTSPGGHKARVLGATLWTDFELFGPELRAGCQMLARRDMNDFSIVKILDQGETRRFDPNDARRIFEMSVRFLEEELEKPFEGVTVVITHHAPSPKSVSEHFAQDRLSAAYASDLERLIEAYRPALWVHGHIHTSRDYRLGATRVICNPRGYWPDDLNPDFVWGKTVGIG